MKEFASANKHYSEKGGHYERGQYHRQFRTLEYQMARPFSWHIRRKMLRNPKSGKG